MKRLFLGDTTPYLAGIAHKNDSGSKLITQENLEDFLNSPSGSFYSSLGDFFDIDLFCQMLDLSDEINYCPPPDGKWSDLGKAPDPRYNMETETQEHLYQWSYIKRKPVYGLQVPDFLDPVFDNTIHYNHRITNGQQIWAFGCSITVGIGVSENQRYANLVGESLGLPVNTIAYIGSSAKWASDQILSSDIKKNDIVIWGLTSLNRFGYFLHDKRYYHILPSFLDDYPLMKNLFEPDKMISPNVFYESFRSIMTADNFCNKIGAHLIILGVFPRYSKQKEIKKNYQNFVATDRSFLDHGSDGWHPGPRHHELYKNKVLDYIKLNDINIQSK